MGYLELPGEDLPRFKRMIISLWFIIEQDAVDAVRQASAEWNAANAEVDDPIIPPLHGVIPFITFGAKWGTYSSHTRQNVGPVGTVTFGETAVTVDGPPGCSQTEIARGTQSFTYGQNYAAGKAHPLDPCYIGVAIPDYDPDNAEASTPRLTMRIQYGDIPTTTWLSVSQGSITNSTIRYIYTGLFGAECGIASITTDQGTLKYIPRGTFKVNTAYKDDSATWYDWFQGRESLGGVSQIKVEVGKWHHLLLSFDFSGSIDATGHPTPDPSVPQPVFSTCKLWVALDDENYTGNDLPAMWVSGEGLQPGGAANAVITYQSSWAASTVMSPTRHQVSDRGGFVEESTLAAFGPGTYSWTPSNIPDGGIGIPATSDIVDQVRHCEMAELQMWFGKFIDTGIENNRRAFIDFEDVEEGAGTMYPVPPSEAKALLGRPDILLHTTRNWQSGKNTGSLGMDDLKQLIPAGQFNPYGTIKKYKPDPSLEK